MEMVADRARHTELLVLEMVLGEMAVGLVHPMELQGLTEMETAVLLDSLALLTELQARMVTVAA